MRAAIARTIVAPPDFSTAFPATENPISQSGAWVLGLADGKDWTDPKTTGGQCVASTVPTPFRYSDDIAHIKTTTKLFTANQFAQGVVYIAPGYVAGGGFHEIELLTRFFIRPDPSTGNAHGLASGYESSLGIDSSGLPYAFIARWNGQVTDFTSLIDPHGGLGSYTNAPTFPVMNDVVRVEIVGTTITLKQNGTVILTATDSTFSSGQAGVGFWPVDGATPDNFGWKSLLAGNL